MAYWLSLVGGKFQRGFKVIAAPGYAKRDWLFVLVMRCRLGTLDLLGNMLARLWFHPQDFGGVFNSLGRIAVVIVVAEQVEGVYRLPGVLAAQRVRSVMNPARLRVGE